MATKVKAPRLSAVCKDESDHHLEHKELEWDQSDMIDLSDPQNDIEILEHKEPMAFAIPPVTDKLISAPLTVNQTAQGQETAALRTWGTEPQTPSSAVEHIEECICDNTDVMGSGEPPEDPSEDSSLANESRGSHSATSSTITMTNKENVTFPTCQNWLKRQHSLLDHTASKRQKV